LSSPRRTAAVLIALGVGTALALTGCASNSEGTGPTGSISNSVGEQQNLATLVPAAIQSAGKLIVGVNVPYSPNEYLQNGKVVGFDVDLMDATAQVLGLTTTYRQAAFEKIIPAVQSGTMDVGMSSFTDTKEREKSVDFVDYFSAGFGWAEAAGGNVDPANACGLKVSVQSNTTEQLDELPRLSKLCTKAGKPKIDVQSYTSQADATNALVVGRVDAMIADSPITAYAIKQTHGKLQQAGDITGAAPYGWAIKKGSGLVNAMQQALQSLMDSGTYDQICKKWGVEAGEIQQATINKAVS
jgi:polar amino acid transport system substrate-binding protein